jgi:hypothetical protein
MSKPHCSQELSTSYHDWELDINIVVIVAKGKGGRLCLYWTVVANKPTVQPWDETRVNMEQQWNDTDKKNQRTPSKTCPSVTLSITNPTLTILSTNSGLHSQKHATNCSSYGTAWETYALSLLFSSVPSGKYQDITSQWQTTPLLYNIHNSSYEWPPIWHYHIGKGNLNPWLLARYLTWRGSSAMVLAVSRRSLTAEAWARNWFCPCGICSGQSGIGTGFSKSSLTFPRQYHSTMALHTHISPGK